MLNGLTARLLLTSAVLVFIAVGAGSSASASPAPAKTPQIVIDNDTPGFSRKGFDSVSSAGGKEHYRTDYRLGTGSGDESARWTPTISDAGRYRVFVKWSSADNRPVAVPLTIHDAGGGVTKRTLDQRRNGLNWHAVGEYDFDRGTGGYVEMTDAGGPNTVADAVKFVKVDVGAPAEYNDDFDDEAEDDDPSHWIEANNFDDWKTAKASDGGLAYHHRTTTHRSGMSWLHVFEQDVEVSTDFRVASHAPELAKLRLAVRHNAEGARILAGYDFVTERWHIKDLRGEDFEPVTLAESDPMPLAANTQHTLRVRAEGNRVALYLDGAAEPLLETDMAEHTSPGRIALDSGGTDAYFDNVKVKLLSGQGQVQDGVLDYTLSPDGVYREGATIIDLKNDQLALRHRGELFTSSNAGQTFTQQPLGAWPENGHGHHSILRLASGKLLNMVAEYDGQPPADDPPLRFRAKLSGDDGESWTDGGLTWRTFREGLPGKSAAIVMNDKLSQASTGRIFYTVTIRKDDGTKNSGHKAEIYFSDDDGMTWSHSAQDSDDFISEPTPSYAEGKVIETADGKLRLYTPYTDQPTMRSAESSDGGLTWHSEQAVPGIMNSKSSFSVAVDESTGSKEYFMVWVFNDAGDHSTTFLPRSRLALARSDDGVNWHYVMDLDRWVSPRDTGARPITQFVDPGLTITKDHVFVTAGRSESMDSAQGHNGQMLRVYRVDRNKMAPYQQWPNEF